MGGWVSALRGGEGVGWGTETAEKAKDWVGEERPRVSWWEGWWQRWFGYEDYVSLWDYAGRKPDEITVARGRILLLLGEKYMAGRRWRWAWVRDRLTGKEGFLPRAYLAPHAETLRAEDTYSGLWYRGSEDPHAVGRALRQPDVPLGTFAVCNMAQGDLNALEQLVLLVRLGCPSEVRPAASASSMAEDEDPFRDNLVQAYQVRRDAHLRYYVNPGRPSPNLYMLVSRLKSTPMTLSVRLGESLGRTGTGPPPPVPPPPAHPTRVVLNRGPNIHDMSRAEKKAILRPYGIRSAAIRLETKLGAGNFGEVYKGFWDRKKQGDQLAVAVKKLHAKEWEDKGDKFCEEAVVMATLDHPNIIAFFGYDAAEQYLVTELILDGSLLNLLQNSQDKSHFNQHSFVDIIYQVACGMAHVVDQGFVHRDLAARNCLLGRGQDGRKVIKVSDFGLTRPITAELLRGRQPAEVAEWRAGLCQGYPWESLAPETLARQIFSPKTDVWAFGILIQEVWSMGGRPYGLGNEFEGDADKFLEFLAGGGRVSPLDSVPPGILRLQQLCMDGDPATRPSFPLLQKHLHAQLSHNAFSRTPDQLFAHRVESRANGAGPSLLNDDDEDYENV